MRKPTAIRPRPAPSQKKLGAELESLELRAKAHWRHIRRRRVFDRQLELASALTRIRAVVKSGWWPPYIDAHEELERAEAGAAYWQTLYDQLKAARDPDEEDLVLATVDLARGDRFRL